MSRTGYIKDTTEKKFDIIHTAKSVGVSYVVSVLLLFLLAVCATVSDMDGKMVNIFITLITCISVTLGGFMSARGTGRGGLLNGVLAGIIYTMLLYLAGGIINGDVSFNGATIVAMLLGIICGGTGGVLGVNTKRRRR